MAGSAFHAVNDGNARRYCSDFLELAGLNDKHTLQTVQLPELVESAGSPVAFILQRFQMKDCGAGGGIFCSGGAGQFLSC